MERTHGPSLGIERSSTNEQVKNLAKENPLNFSWRQETFDVDKGLMER
jgi:hypothetical protein